MKENFIGKTAKLEAKIIGTSLENGEKYLRLSKEDGRSILVPEHWVEILKKGGEGKDGLQGNSSE